MTIPRATYRLQFRNGVTFDRAADLAPYLRDLGVSHLYASPIFAAAPGSLHGYDVVDHTRFDPKLGGEEGFCRLAEALTDSGIGLLLDIVPNHMAVSTANPWWRDVLKYGRESRYARHFDIDWTAPKLLLPVLGEPYGEALAEGKFELRLDEDAAEIVFCYFDLAVPVHPDTLALIMDGEPLGDILADSDRRRSVEHRLAAISTDVGLMHRLHEAQIWRLAYWRLAREALTYRRFFEIADLIGVRVEDASVFADVHKRMVDLANKGILHGLRIDHIDGLADPKGYLARLREQTRLEHVVVEKILGPGEEPRPDWAFAGTTGYEIGRLINALQVDSSAKEALTAAWVDFTGDDPDYDRQVQRAKRRILRINLAGELEGLVQSAHRIATSDPCTRDFGPDSLRHALIELAIAFPVYRTYVDGDGPSEEDRRLILAAAAHVDREREVEDERVVRFVASLLLEPADGSPVRKTFIRRFQQTTGPLMAKAVEDTVFYRYNRLVALNEVGAEPDAFGVEPAEFHDFMQRRADAWPAALSATATHDTKRGEDARARLAVISELPDEWAAAVARWSAATTGLREDRPDGAAPGRRGQWLFFQALAGAWPSDLTLEDEAGLEDLCGRLVMFMTKALREAKQRTSWTDQNEPFEAAVESYVRGVFSPDHRNVLTEIRSFIAGIEPAGIVNSLAQLALKLTLPGVPDIYQGCELFDFSMVDPDNRRPVDFDLRRGLLTECRDMDESKALARRREGLPKLWLLHRLLNLRAQLPDLFAKGAYEPLIIDGTHAAHVLAFARTFEGERVVVLVPRLVRQFVDANRPSLLDVAAFSDTYIPGETGAFETLSGRRIEADAGLKAGQLWARFPVCILRRLPRT